MLPKQLKIGGMIYDINITDQPIVLNTKQCRGLIDYERQTITIAGDSLISDQTRLRTLCHEIIHAFTFERGIDWGDQDEYYTDQLAAAMHQFFVDNNIKLEDYTHER